MVLTHGKALLLTMLVATAFGIVVTLLVFLGLPSWGQAPAPPPGPPTLERCQSDVLVLRDQNLQLQRIIGSQLQRLTEFEQRQLEADKAAAVTPKPVIDPSKVERKK